MTREEVRVKAEKLHNKGRVLVDCYPELAIMSEECPEDVIDTLGEIYEQAVNRVEQAIATLYDRIEKET